MIDQIEIRGARMVFSIAALLCLLAAPALGDDRPWEQPRWHAINAGFYSSGEDISSGQRWLESPLHTDERHEFEYDRSLSLNFKRTFLFSIQDPLIGEWAPGFAFEYRF